MLRRHGLSRPERCPKEPPNRYECPCPGDLLHMDTAPYARFERPGHAVTGSIGGDVADVTMPRNRPALNRAGTEQWWDTAS